MTIRTVMLFAAILSTACSVSQSPSPSVLPVQGTSASPSPSSPAVKLMTPTPLPLTFHASAPQARMVATLVAFLDAYNAGRVDAALALLTENVSISDCGYGPVRLITATGTAAARQWLSERTVDHDQLVLESVRNENPDPTTGSDVVAAGYVRRSSDTLRSLGYANGIEPQTATKVGFTPADDRIRAFGNGPFGGSISTCQPRS